MALDRRPAQQHQKDHHGDDGQRGDEGVGSHFGLVLPSAFGRHRNINLLDLPDDEDQHHGGNRMQDGHQSKDGRVGDRVHQIAGEKSEQESAEGRARATQAGDRSHHVARE